MILLIVNFLLKKFTGRLNLINCSDLKIMSKLIMPLVPLIQKSKGRDRISANIMS